MSYGLLRNKRLFERFKDDEFRSEYVASRVRSRMAILIRALRKARGWSQADLAKQASTTQSVISRIEDPDYEGTSLQSLFAIAGAFKLPVWVDMPEWKEWAIKSEELASESLKRRGFDELQPEDVVMRKRVTFDHHSNDDYEGFSDPQNNTSVRMHTQPRGDGSFTIDVALA